MNNKTIGVFVGSLLRGSFSRSIAKAAVSLAPEELEFRFIDIGSLPLYNQDFDDDGQPPEFYQSFRREVANLDGFLFVTPEYNRSVPAVLKNALDVASRPYGHNGWSGKPGGIHQRISRRTWRLWSQSPSASAYGVSERFASPTAGSLYQQSGVAVG